METVVSHVLGVPYLFLRAGFVCRSTAAPRSRCLPGGVRPATRAPADKGKHKNNGEKERDNNSRAKVKNHVIKTSSALQVAGIISLHCMSLLYKARHTHPLLRTSAGWPDRCPERGKDKQTKRWVLTPAPDFGAQADK